MRRQRTLDWRFLIALSLLALVCFLIWNGFAAQRQATLAGHRADVAGHRADVLIQRLQDQEHDAAARDSLLLTQVHDLLAQVNDLQYRYGTQQASYNHLLRWLHRHGIAVPTRYVIAPRVVRRPSGASHSAPRPPTSPPRPPTHQAQPAPPPAPAPTLPNGKPAPGNSGNAPGHLKH